MEIVKGKIVSGEENPVQNTEKTIELLTNPVPVRRYKLPFGAVVVIQTVITALLGAFLWYAEMGGGVVSEFAAELVRRLTNG
ncbi:MAG: hypothetical protein IJ416_01490 [Ruminiclostridium sp.]|nr:hypothetical protein [Ruminiclostridium sp.]